MCNNNNIYTSKLHFIQYMTSNNIQNIVSKPELDDIITDFTNIENIIKTSFPERKNFLNYNYFLHKKGQLLQNKELQEKFPLLIFKHKETLTRLDNIWRVICKQLDYDFISSTFEI